ncbi:MAG: hypothetical protein IKN74_02550 [Clostridia bacterium]|nr:hypothetical protein [Clostridia bacterium]
MENASKALIIAGAILLSILIIAIGMYIYNSSSNSIYEASDQISTQSKDAFNSQWESYERKQPGSNVKSMISKLIANAQTNEEEKTKLPDLFLQPTEDDAAAQTFRYVGSYIMDNKNVQGFNAARSAIQNKHEYFVEIHYSVNTSLVDAVAIHYYQPDGVSLIKDFYEDDTIDDVGMVDEAPTDCYDNSVLSTGRTGE